jgi:type IV pilus assembly protein PilC
MAKYVYRAKRSPTTVIDGQVEAVSEDDAVQKISEMGLTPFHVSLAGAPMGQTKVTAQKRQAPVPVSQPFPQPVSADKLRVKAQDIDRFTRQLATLVKSKVPLLRALFLIAEQPGNRTFQAAIADLAAQVRQGHTLSGAMAKYPLVFDSLYISMVLAGERGGVLETSLVRLAEHREKQREIRRHIQGALAYPLFVVSVGAVTVFAVITFFLPRVTGLFRDIQQDLPLPTEILLAMTDFMSVNWHWIIIVALLLGAILFRNRPGSRKKMALDFLKLHLPVVRRLVSSAEIARFARTMALLVRNGVSVHEGLVLATKTVGNEAMRSNIEQAGVQIVSRGATLSGSLARTNVFPRFVINMITVGEEGGELEEAMDEVATAYEREVEQSVKVVLSLLEPVLILLVGGVVAFIVFAMLLPIFDIGGL